MRGLLILLALLLPGLALAQSQATLLADRVEVTADQRLIATGVALTHMFKIDHRTDQDNGLASRLPLMPMRA